MKKGLDNILDLCWEMGLPQWKFNSIHVAGTNGKGSVSAQIQNIIQPFLHRFLSFPLVHRKHLIELSQCFFVLPILHEKGKLFSTIMTEPNYWTI
ncbi:MAG: hypothetical protein AAFV78_12830, partial [Bacteroidota bacterium]